MRPHRRQPTRLCRPWDSPGKNTGVVCHFLLQCMKEKGEREVPQSCPTLSDPMDCSLPGSSVHGIFQPRVLKWVTLLLLLLSCFSRVQLLATPWTAAYQAPPSMGFSRQEYWSGVPLPSPNQCCLIVFKSKPQILILLITALLIPPFKTHSLSIYWVPGTIQMLELHGKQ